jgi:hypothetical protein
VRHQRRIALPIGIRLQKEIELLRGALPFEFRSLLLLEKLLLPLPLLKGHVVVLLLLLLLQLELIGPEK